MDVPGCRCALKKFLIVRASKPGSAKTRESQLVSIWPAESRDDEGQPVREPRSDHLFRPELKAPTLATRSPPLGLRGARTAPRPAVVVSEKPTSGVLGDGSELDLELGFGTIPAATQIVTLSCQRTLSQVGKIIYGDSPEGKPWDSSGRL